MTLHAERSLTECDRLRIMSEAFPSRCIRLYAAFAYLASPSLAQLSLAEPSIAKLSLATPAWPTQAKPSLASLAQPCLARQAKPSLQLSLA